MNRISRRRVLAFASVVGLWMAGCAPAAATAPAAPSATAPEQSLAPLVQASPVTQLGEATATEVVTPTPGPFVLNLTPVPTETPLPTLELPTEAPRLPALEAWDGLPTYPAESRPDYFFRVRFDPQAWALTTDAFGSPALAHRSIANCIISPTEGRGLPPNATVDHEMRRIGGISYQISTVSADGVKQSATYVAGDGRIYTAFQVAVQDSPEQCLQEAETVLATLTSVQVSEATPIATP